MISLDSRLLIAIFEDWNSSELGNVAFVSAIKIGEKNSKNYQVLVMRYKK
jgi:hypothetical protein